MTFKSDKNKQANNGESERQGANDLAKWIPIGVGFGIPLGLVFHNLALGIALGAALGLAIGAAMTQRGKEPQVGYGGKQAGRLVLLVSLGVLLLLVVVVTFAFLAMK
jgi:hypothetical protein